MKIYVCIKQVPNTTNVKIDQEKGILIRNNVDSILNPADKNALEIALKIKDLNKDTIITAISMGPLQAKDVLFEAICMGVDNAVLLCDRAFAGSDTFVTSHIIATAIKKLGMPDLILTGKQAIDGETAQVGPQIAEKLGLCFETAINEVKNNNTHLIVNKLNNDSNSLIEINLPCLLTVNSDCNLPRNMTVYNISNISEENIQVLTIKDLDLNEKDCGLIASPTKVVETFVMQKNKQCQFIRENIEENILKILKNT